jgi:hypothetical protein
VVAGALFRTGQYDGLPVLAVRSLVTEVREDSGQVQMFQVTRQGDTSTELPFTFSLTGDGFEPGPLASTFNAGDAVVTFGIRPENNSVNTGSRILTFSLLPEAYLNIDPEGASASVTIFDDDTGGGASEEPEYLEATMQGGWWQSSWFGWYFRNEGDWRWHTEHGWVFLLVDSSGGGMFIHDLGTGRWMWTTREFWTDPSFAVIYVLPDPARTLSGWFVFWRGASGDDRWFTQLDTDQSYQAPSFRE